MATRRGRKEAKQGKQPVCGTAVVHLAVHVQDEFVAGIEPTLKRQHTSTEGIYEPVALHEVQLHLRLSTGTGGLQTTMQRPSKQAGYG